MSHELNFKFSKFHIEKVPLSKTNLQEVEGWIEVPQHSYSEGRLREWLAGRYCAKMAARKIGVKLNSLSAGNDRAPIWPDGIVGSISHTKELAIAAVSTEVKMLGVDCEKLMSIERFENLKNMFVREDELPLINSNLKIAPTLCFSAKETLYKCVAPKCKCYFGFMEASVIDISQDSFVINLHSQNPAVSPFNGHYQGRFSIFDNTLITYIEYV